MASALNTVEMPARPEATLPALFAPWLRAVAGGTIAGETKATCDHCAMLPTAGSLPGPAFFRPATKCCAYQPSLPNFLAGAILSDEDPLLAEGRAALERRIARRVAITPDSAGSGAVFSLLYGNTPKAFGRAPALRCPYMTSAGGCGVWRHRPGVCATWYCKHDRGALGLNFWTQVAKLMREAERELALWCIAELRACSVEVLDLPVQARPDVSELEGDIDWGRYRKLWGEWAGREIDFYRACYRLVEPLSWDQVERICGQRVRILAGLVRDAYENLQSPEIPERLRLGQFHFVGSHGGGYEVTTYSEFDPLFMPEPLVRSLRYFDGRPTVDALEAILKEQNVRVHPSLVRRMLDFGILERWEDAGPFPIVT